jgi:ketosteroid isomerase-like protein
MNKTLWRVTLVAGLLACGLAACTRAPAADSERVALGAAIHRWIAAVNAQDVTTLTATMTEDVELFDASGATVRGREGVIRALCDVSRGKLGAVTLEMTVANDVAWHVVGLTRNQKNGDVQGQGQALEIWKRLNGEWKLHRRMVTGVVSPEVSLTRPSTNEPVLDRPRN